MKSTARITGVWYLLLAICGFVGFLFVRPAIYAHGDAALTARQFAEHLSLARLGLAAEFGVIVAQALAAMSFFSLFRSVNVHAAASTAAFGLMNSVAVLISAIALAMTFSFVDDAKTVHFLYELSGNAWSVGALFFGLWLIPMGHATRLSGAMPKALGWTLMVGGVGYVLSAFVGNVLDGAPRWLVDGLTVPASIGEFWMIGFLLVVGWRSR